jgi:tryptophan 2,3-dioxygenase
MSKDKPNTSPYYQDYLGLEKILNNQHLLSEEYGKPSHDEMLFIIIHQIYELWFKQILFELDSILEIFSKEKIQESQIGIAVSRLDRVIEIQKILIGQIQVLETMTPMDFLDFRDFLIPASGFQSVQFRLIENKLGFRGTDYHAHLKEPEQAKVLASESTPSLFNVMEKWLERTPFLNWGVTSFWNEYEQAVAGMLDDDRQVIKTNKKLSKTEKEKHLKEYENTEASFGVVLSVKEHNKLVKEGKWRLSHKATQGALLILLYRDQPILYNPYHLLTKLVDVDELFTTWRYRHALMVSRMIGRKIGTGGSTGSEYLNKTAEKHRIFRDFSELTTFLIPRSALPQLPQEVENNLGFFYHVR